MTDNVRDNRTAPRKGATRLERKAQDNLGGAARPHTTSQQSQGTGTSQSDGKK